MKNTKRSLFVSVLSLVLCLAMLLGTTYAWFTDSVQSGKNTIVAGNLDVELEHYNAKVTTPTTVEQATDLFRDKDGGAIKWEPGVVAYENFIVSNKGDLALKYSLQIAASDYNTVTVEGKQYDLRDVIKVAVIDSEHNATLVDTDGNYKFNGDRDAAKALTYGDFSSYAITDKALAVEGKDTFAIVLYWQPSDNDNIYNINNAKQVDTKRDNKNELFIDLGINLVATQNTVENDSFNNQYDADANLPSMWDGSIPDTKPADTSIKYDIENRRIYVYDAPGFAYLNKMDSNGLPVARAEILQLLAAASIPNWESEKIEVVINDDIDFLGNAWTPMKLAFCIDGNNKTIKNIVINGDYGYAGLFTTKDNNNTGAGYVKNLTLDTITVTNTREDSATGTISGYANYAIENCKVINATVNGGKYVGGIAGQGYSSIKNCTVENSAIDGKYKVGGLTGQLNNEKDTIYATGNTVKNSSVTCTDVMSGKTAQLGKFIGYKNEAGGNITVNSNTATNVTGPNKDIGNE